MTQRPEPLPRFIRAISLLSTLGLGLGVAAVLATGSVAATCATKLAHLTARGMIRATTAVAARVF